MIRRATRIIVTICRIAILRRLVPIRITASRIRANRRNHLNRVNRPDRRIIITNRIIAMTAQRAAAVRRAIVRQSV